MFSHNDSFEVPVPLKIGEREITVPLLSQRDYLGWIAELTKARQEIGRKNAPPMSKPNERSRWLDWIDNMELAPADLQPYVMRAAGTIRVLETALKKTGALTDQEIATFIDSRPAKSNEMLAVQLSGLFRKEEILNIYPPSEKPPEKPDPNAPSPT